MTFTLGFSSLASSRDMMSILRDKMSSVLSRVTRSSYGSNGGRYYHKQSCQTSLKSLLSIRMVLAFIPVVLWLTLFTHGLTLIPDRFKPPIDVTLLPYLDQRFFFSSSQWFPRYPISTLNDSSNSHLLRYPLNGNLNDYAHNVSIDYGKEHRRRFQLLKHGNENVSFTDSMRYDDSGYVNETILANTGKASRLYDTLDLIAAVPYTLHSTLPFIYLAVGILNAPLRASLPRFVVTFGLMNLAAVSTHLAHPTAPPWYHDKYGITPANYSVMGEAARLARLDERFQMDMFHHMYADASKIVFGSWPSLHAAWPYLIMRFPPMLPYPLRSIIAMWVVIVWWAAIYLGHHYLVDIVGGVIYAEVALALTNVCFAFATAVRSGSPGSTHASKMTHAHGSDIDIELGVDQDQDHVSDESLDLRLSDQDVNKKGQQLHVLPIMIRKLYSFL